MSEIEKRIVQARRFEFGRVHHHRDAEVLYEMDSTSDECAVALGRRSIEKLQFSLMKGRTDTLARLRRAAATSEPSFLRKLAIYMAYLNDSWDSESIHLIYLAFQKGDCLAEYIMSILLDDFGDVVMEVLSLPDSDRKALCLECLQRSTSLGYLEASCTLGCYYWNVGRVEEALRMLTQAAEGGCFEAFKLLAWSYPSVVSDAYCVDMDALLSHATRLACDMNDCVTAGQLADYLADDERGALVDRVAALRFHRRSFRKESWRHGYVIFGDRRWDMKNGPFWGTWLLFLRDDYLLDCRLSHFPKIRTVNRLQVA